MRASRSLTVACLLACGDVADVEDAGDAAVRDATVLDATADATSDASDGAPFVDAPPPIVSCADASDYVEVDGDVGTFSFTAGCGDAATPTATIAGCSDKVECLYVSGCGGGSIVLSSIDGWPPGSKHGGVASLTLGDAGTVEYSGWIALTAWPDAGAVPGAYAVSSQDAGAFGGTFCVTRR
jgi:hypothetical protein